MRFPIAQRHCARGRRTSGLYRRHGQRSGSAPGKRRNIADGDRPETRPPYARGTEPSGACEVDDWHGRKRARREPGSMAISGRTRRTGGDDRIVDHPRLPSRASAAYTPFIRSGQRMRRQYYFEEPIIFGPLACKVQALAPHSKLGSWSVTFSSETLRPSPSPSSSPCRCRKRRPLPRCAAGARRRDS